MAVLYDYELKVNQTKTGTKQLWYVLGVFVVEHCLDNI